MSPEDKVALKEELEARLAAVRLERATLRGISDHMEYCSDRWALRGYINMAQESLKSAEGYLQEAIEWIG